MKNFFIFIFNNIEDNNIINYYKDYYNNFCIIENNIDNYNLFHSIIRNEKLSVYYKLEENNNINFFILNNLNYNEYDNYIFINANMNNNMNNTIIHELENNIYDDNIYNFNLSSKNFKYYIIKKDNLIEIKKKYLL
jgi:hypothetical protein